MIAKIISYFGADGLAHIIVCNALVAFLSLILPVWVAVVATAVIGVGKELLWDKIMRRGNFEAKDLLADAIGIIFGIV